MDRIVDAAGRLFARQGYHGTTTREIALLADVSENTLFRHFDHKEDLLWSALRSNCKGLKLHLELMKEIARSDAPEVVLPRILELLANMVNYRPELLRLLAVAFLELNAKAVRFCHEQLSPAISAIHCSLESAIRAGAVREVDATILTSALIMTAITLPGLSSMVNGDKLAYFSAAEMQRAQAGFWLELLTTRGTALPWAQGQGR